MLTHCTRTLLPCRYDLSPSILYIDINTYSSSSRQSHQLHHYQVVAVPSQMKIGLVHNLIQNLRNYRPVVPQQPCLVGFVAFWCRLSTPREVTWSCCLFIMSSQEDAYDGRSNEQDDGGKGGSRRVDFGCRHMASSVLCSVTSLRRTQNIGQTASQKHAFRNAFQSL